MIKAGIIGRDPNFNEHLQALNGITDLKMMGLFIPGNFKSDKFGEELLFFHSFNEMLKKCDALLIINPVKDDISLIRKAIKNAKDIFLSGPGDHTIREANEIIKLSGEAGIALHVARYARYNPSFRSCLPYAGDVRLINISRGVLHRSENTRDAYAGSLVQDADLILAFTSSKVKKISATSFPVEGTGNDMLSARIIFDTGTIANIQYNPFDEPGFHCMDIFQPSQKISIDFINGEVTITRSVDNCNKSILSVSKGNGFGHPVESELEVFVQKILNREKKLNDIEENYASFYLASEIQDKVQQASLFFSKQVL
ncbi:MAG: Gfo/Idh/MocA family oxidoreductase [Bacteroidota bacterium]